MKRLLFTIAVLAAVSAVAQKNKQLSGEYEYKVSEPYKVIDADDKYYLSEDGKVLSVKIDKRDIYVQRFDADKPALASVKEYEDAFPKNAVYERILFVNGKAMLFFTQWDGDNEIEQLFVQEIDMDKGEFNGSAKLILQVKGRVTGEGSGRVMDFNLTNKFPVYRSFDKKSFLVKYRKKPETKRDTKSFDVIGLVAFDGDLNKQTSREVTMPYTERRMDNLDFQLDNKGNVYLLNKIFEDDSAKDKKKKSDETPNYHIEVFTLKPGADKFKVTTVESQKLFINRLTIYDSPKGDMIVAGFYNKNLAKGGFFSKGEYAGFDPYSNCDGIITYKMKDDGTLTDMFTYEIPVELLNQNESKKTKRKNAEKEEDGESAKFTDLRPRGIKIDKDGNIIFLAEQYYIKEHTTSGGMNGMSSRTYYSYHYNEALIAKLTADGKLAWMRKIPKVQYGLQGQGSMGYTYFRNANDHFLVFFDNPDNIDLPADEVPKVYSDRKKGYLTAVRISDVDGSVSRGSILNVKEVDDFKLYQISTDRIVKVTENTFLMEAYKKSKEDIMIKVILK